MNTNELMTSELMNQLTTTNTSLTFQSPRAAEADAAQLRQVLAQAMAKAFAYTGINVQTRQDDITYMVDNLPAEVVRTVPAIRLSEIPVAINKGVLKQYGEYYGLNIATFMQFLIAHYQSEQRREAIKAHLAASTNIQPAPPTEAELQQTRLNRIATAFAHYKAHGHYEDHGSLVFDHINRMGKMPFSPEREAEILSQARQNMIDRHSRMSIYPDERANLRATLNAIINGEAPNIILKEAKRIALFELFDGLLEKGLGVLEWLGKSGFLSE